MAKTDAERQADARARRQQELAALLADNRALQKEVAALRAERDELREKLHRAQLRLAKIPKPGKP